MKRNVFITSLIVVTIMAGAAIAQQGPRGGGPGTPPAGPQSVITGTVVSFVAGVSQGMPSLTIVDGGSELTLVLGPFWFLQNSKFTAAAGDLIEANVIGCDDCPSGLAVIAVRNVTNGTSATLRNNDGTPLWISGAQRGSRGRGMTGRGNGVGGAMLGHECNGNNGPDMTKVATFAGSVKSFEGGPGLGRPTLVLQTAAGDQTFIVAPYRAIRDAGLEFVVGDALTITAAPNAIGELVVVSLKTATGGELVLRDAQTGKPAGGRRGGCMMGR